MNKKYIIWGIGSIIVYGLLTYFTLNARYLYNADFKYITILEFDNSLLVTLLVCLIFLVFLGIAYFFIKRLKPEWLQSKFIFYMMLLPAYPALGGLFKIILDLVNKNESYYFRLGNRFIVQHITDFPASMSVSQIVTVGEGLKYGGGLFLSILLLLIIIGNTWMIYYVYYKKYIKEFI